MRMEFPLKEINTFSPQGEVHNEEMKWSTNSLISGGFTYNTTNH